MARIRSVSSYQHLVLEAGWELTWTAPGAAADPSSLRRRAVEWLRAPVPGTVASALRAAGRWDWASTRSFDEEDFWYRCQFVARPPLAGSRMFLRLDGLATVADVWLNDAPVLRSENMYLAHALDVSELLRPEAQGNELYIRFHALSPLLQARRARPRWRTRLVEAQQLRWFRTTLLGRMPGFCPKAAPVGPFRRIVLEERQGIQGAGVHVRAGAEPGLVQATLRLQPLGDVRPLASAQLLVGDRTAPLELASEREGQLLLRGELRLPDAALWWPHTHGEQPLHPVLVSARIADRDILIDCGHVGFRRIDLHTGAGEDFALHVNGVPVFCRGACWTPLDVLSLSAPAASYREALQTARDAGMNMLRVPGNMLYEAPAFYDLCDELGILVWQEFMFANMDYPIGERAFAESVRAEVAQLLDRLEQSPALAVLCGSSEVEQQAAMLGLPREQWKSPLFEELLPELCRAYRPDVPYWSSSPSGGELPFQVNAGVAHYYGVGAYLRPLDDARRSEVRFAAECLAFANVPEPSTVEACFAGPAAVTHHPQWKARVPRDPGAGWDFEDVRDHYLRTLFDEDPVRLRSSDTPRYLLLSRIVTGEVMASTFAEWRRLRSRCHGALVWLYRDLWPGAGWGLIDALGTPKAGYYYLKRSLRPLCLFITDEGLNGLYIHIVNETAQSLELHVHVALFRDGKVRVGEGEAAVSVPARSTIELPMSRVLPPFSDTSYAYRFGPPSHELVIAKLHERTGTHIHTAFWFPIGFPRATHQELGLAASATPRPDGTYALSVRTEQFAQAVHVDAPGFLPDDSYFHLEPGGQRAVLLRPREPAKKLRGTLSAVNTTATPVRIDVKPETSQ